MSRLTILSLALLIASCATTNNTAESGTDSTVVATSGQDEEGEAAPPASVEPGGDWLFWAEGDVFVVDEQVWWTAEDLNATLAKSPPLVPEEVQGMDVEAARPVVNSFVAASIRVKANKALVDWHLDQKGITATQDGADAWYQKVETLLAGPKEREVLARLSGRDAPMANEEGMQRAARRNARLAQLMLADGPELAVREQAEALYDEKPERWQVPGEWTVHVVECASEEECEQFEDRVTEAPDRFAELASELDGDHGEVTLRAQAGTPARPLLNAFDSRSAGAVTPVIETGGAYWVGRLANVKAPHVPEFDEVADTILASRHIARLNAFEDELVRKLRADHEVQILWNNVRFRLGDEVATLSPPRNTDR